MNVYNDIVQHMARGRKSLAVLIDPDGVKTNDLELITELCNHNDVDYFLVGGSLLADDQLDQTIQYLKSNSDIPVVLFPGNEIQLHEDADAILFLALISGRNPEYLISKHVVAAPRLRKMNIEVIPTGYLLIHGHRPSSASYISATIPIPSDKPNLAAATALAGQYLGHRLIYLEGGSGASRPISEATIRAVKKVTDVPIIVGGGIKNAEQMKKIYQAGADVQVIGTAIERRPDVLKAFAKAKQEINQELSRI